MNFSVTISQDEVMVSFDVESLFTNVPVDQALMIIHEKLVHDDTLQDRTSLTPDHFTMLLETCLKTTYFIYQQDYYEQTEGAAMGSPVSPVVANIFMEHVKEEALRTCPHQVRFWRRYVDDTSVFYRSQQ